MFQLFPPICKVKLPLIDYIYQLSFSNIIEPHEKFMFSNLVM